MDIAHKLSLKLREAEDRIAQLEGDIRHYQERAARAEKWMHRIHSEIEDRFFKDSGGGAERLRGARRHASRSRLAPMPTSVLATPEPRERALPGGDAGGEAGLQQIAAGRRFPVEHLAGDERCPGRRRSMKCASISSNAMPPAVDIALAMSAQCRSAAPAPP